MTSFRFHLDYHIKSSKTYLHGRMRNRAEQWKNCGACFRAVICSASRGALRGGERGEDDGEWKDICEVVCTS